ncbi:MAG: hypothetical protein N2Z82_07655 [Thermomicrobium sp.]|nr:hypothetical protein [Thermomicrobium sp.]
MGTHVRQGIALAPARWGAWLWGWTGRVLATRYGAPARTTELRRIADWFLAPGAPPLPAAFLFRQKPARRASLMALACMAPLARWSQHLARTVVGLVTGLRTGTRSGVLEALFARRWLADLLVVPHGWSDLGSWTVRDAWGFWSQLLVALLAVVQTRRTSRPGRGARRRAVGTAEVREPERAAHSGSSSVQGIANTSWMSLSRVSPARSTGIFSCS